MSDSLKDIEVKPMTYRRLFHWFLVLLLIINMFIFIFNPYSKLNGLFGLAALLILFLSFLFDKVRKKFKKTI